MHIGKLQKDFLTYVRVVAAAAIVIVVVRVVVLDFFLMFSPSRLLQSIITVTWARFL